MTKITIDTSDIITIPEVRNASIIFTRACKSVNDFYALFQAKRTANSRRQDLLRAMLVFACSGLDAVIKQLVKDSLQRVIELDDGANRELQKYISRRVLQQERTDSSGANYRQINIDELVRLLVSDNLRQDAVRMHINDLCSDSLQSRDQILKIATAFAITKDAIMEDPDTIRSAFLVRNQIIHEMDADLSNEKNERNRDETIIKRYCEGILLVGKKFIAVVSGKIDKGDTDEERAAVSFSSTPTPLP